MLVTLTRKVDMLTEKMKVKSIFYKRMIFLAFFFLPGGFFLLAALIFLHEILLNNENGKTK